uniref:hypothetical protein n=1 Tax=Nocardia cyriacigeorgica TaxID=135487 RepID=UPI002455ED3C
PWHFAKKDALLAAVPDPAGNALRAGPGDPSGDGSPNPTEDLLAGVKQPAIAKMSLLFVALFAEAANPDSPIHDKYAGLHEQLREIAERWVDAHVHLPDGVRPDGLATILIAASIGIHLQATMAPELITVEDMVEQLEALIKPLLIEPPRR